MNPQQPQYRPQPHQGPVAPQQPTPGPEQSYGPPAYGDQVQGQAQGQPEHDFSFIMEPANPFKERSKLSNTSSMITKAAVVGGIVVVLLIAFVLVKSLLGGGSSVNTAQLMTVVEDQQELLHLTSTIGSKQGLASATLNSSWTIQVTVGASETSLLTYLKSNGYKAETNALNLKESPSIDTQMTNAFSNGTFDQTYVTVMQNELSTYQQDIKTAYKGDHGAKGHALLNADYTAAQLLSTQISSPAS